MSKKRPTESAWDSDEELLSDTSGITAFPKTTLELDVLVDDGELDEDALLGVDDASAKAVSISFANDSVRPVITRQHSRYNRDTHHTETSVAAEAVVDEQAFVFEDTDTADLEVELTGGHDEEASYTMTSQGDHTASSFNDTGEYSENVSYNTTYEEAPSDLQPHAEEIVDYSQDRGLEAGGSEMVYMGSQTQQYDGGDYSVDGTGTNQQATGEMAGEPDSSVMLTYDQPAHQEEQVHLEYADPSTNEGDSRVDNDNSDSDSDDDSSRHNRGKFTSERTGVISLTSASKRARIPDTLEIDDEQAAQIEQFMNDKGAKGGGRGRPSAHSRLGNRGAKSRPGMMPSLRGPPPRGQFMDGPMRGPMMNMRGPMPMGPMGPLRILANNLLRQRGLIPGAMNMRGRFPGGPRAPFPNAPPLFRGPPSMHGPQGLRSPQGQMRGPRPDGVPPLMMQQANARMGRPPHFGQRGPVGMAARLGGPHGFRPNMPPDMRGPMPLMEMNPPGMRHLGPRMGPPEMRGVMRTGQGLVTRKNKVHVNPRFPGPPQQIPGPLGITRTVKIGKPLQQRKAKALVERARQVQTRTVIQKSTPATPSSTSVKRKSTGEDEVAAKHIRKETTENVEMTEEDNMNKLLEDQRLKREMIQKRKEQARQQQASAKRQELGQPGEPDDLPSTSTTAVSEGAIPTIVKTSRIQSRLGPPPKKQPVRSALTPTQTIQVRAPGASAASRPGMSHTQTQRMVSARPPQPVGPRGQAQRFRPAQANQPQLRPAQSNVRYNAPQDLRFRGPLGVDSSTMRGPPPAQQQQRTSQGQGFPSNSVMMRPTGSSQFQPPLLGMPSQQRMRGPLSAPSQRMLPPSASQAPGVLGARPTFSAPVQGVRPHSAPVQGMHRPVSAQQMRPPAPQGMRGPPPTQAAPAGLGFGAAPANQRLGPRVQQAQPMHQRIGPSVQTRPVHQRVHEPAHQQIQAQPAQQRIGPPVQGQPAHQRIGPPVQGQPTHQRIGPPVQAEPVHQRIGPPVQSQPAHQRIGLPVQSQPAHQRIGPPVQSQPAHQRIGPPVQGQPSLRGPPPVQQRSGPPPGQHLAQFLPSQAGPPQSMAPAVGYSTAPPGPTQYQQQPQVLEHHVPQQQYAPPAQTYHHQEAAAPQQVGFQYEAQAPPQTDPYATPASSHYTPPVSSDSYAYSQQQVDPFQQPQAYAQPEAATSYDQQYDQSTSVYTSQDYQYDYPVEHQPIQTIGSAAPSYGDQRRVQQQQPSGQRIETVSVRAQPTSGNQIQSIIRNVSQPPRRTPQVHINRTVLDGGQVPVLDGPQKVLILNVPQIATRETLLKICKHFGRVLGVNLIREQNKAVVQFETGDQAAKCVSKCDQKCLHKTRITVKLLPN